MEGLITPEIYLKRLKVPSKIFSNICIISFSIKMIKFLPDIYSIKEIKLIPSINLFEIKRNDEKLKFYLAVIRNGAPLATIDFEILIELGFTSFLIIGFCGSIYKEVNSGEYIIIEAAFPGEGTSRYYDVKEIYYSSNELVKIIENILHKLNLKYRIGKIWTTDAFFRETNKLITKYSKMGAICVDMESSALICVAGIRNVKIGAILCTIDKLYDNKWEINLLDRNWKEIRNNLMLIALKMVDRYNKT